MEKDFNKSQVSYIISNRVWNRNITIQKEEHYPKIKGSMHQEHLLEAFTLKTCYVTNCNTTNWKKLLNLCGSQLIVWTFRKAAVLCLQYDRYVSAQSKC
jgi:hypothetical protein